MKCLDPTELRDFLTGRLDPKRLAEVAEHLEVCEACREAALSEIRSTGAREALSSSILGISECPEYEELSAYVDGQVDAERRAAIRSHINMCELCARDVARIEELRSHAAMRPKISVVPAMSRQRGLSGIGMWKRAAGLLGAAAVLAGLAFSFGLVPGGNDEVQTVAVAPQVDRALPDNSSEAQLPAMGNNVEPEAKETAEAVAEQESTKPRSTYATVLADGRHRVVKRSGKLVIANSAGVPIAGKFAATISEKLATGRVNPSQSLAVALGALRSDFNGYVSPTAPTAVAPVEKVVLSDKPTFNWSKVNLADSYLLVVTDKNGAVVFEQVTTDN